MKVNSVTNFPGYFIAVLLVLQYFNSNSLILDTGFNHTLVLQCLFCIISIPFFFVIDRKKSSYLVGIILLFLLFIVIHYGVVLRVHNYIFYIGDLWSYVKFCFYLFIFLVTYIYFKGKDFVVVIRCAKYIVLALFIEGITYVIFKVFGFSSAYLFESIEGRFAGIFIHHNSLVNLFVFFVMSYVIYFGSLREKIIYLTIGSILIALTQERSAIIGLLFLGFSYVLFSYNEDNSFYKYKIKIFFTLSATLVVLVVLYTLNFRELDYISVGMFFRTILIRIYLSFLAIIHLFQSDNPIFGFGPFMSILPANVADMYSGSVAKFIDVVSAIFGITEETYFRSFHDIRSTSSPSYTVNAHNTFIILLYQFGYFFLCILLYFIYLFFVSMNYIKEYVNEISLISKSQDSLYLNEKFFYISSLVFIIASIPQLLFLSSEGYLILTAFAFGHLGSLVRRLKHG